MRTLTLFLLLLLGAGPGFAQDMPPPVDGMPATDQRAIRELQNRTFGKADLATNAPRQEGLLALAELGAAASSGPQAKALSQDDKDALFALLQRYRDELLKMGMDGAELQAQLTILQSRSSELERRLSELKPLDGLKIHGRIYSAFDDLHLLGQPALVPVAGAAAVPVGSGKAAGRSLREQLGSVHIDLRFEGTRGLFSAMTEMGLVLPWGTDQAYIGFRRLSLEMRTPIVVQFGDLEEALSPLTLWRSEQYEPFLPQPFDDRRQRQRDDLLLKENRWHLTGARITTRALLLSALPIDLESITAIVGMPAVVPGGSPLNVATVYQYQVGAASKYLATHFNTYLEAWRLGFPFAEGKGSVSYNGTLFWDETASEFVAVNYRPMNSLIHTGRVEYKGETYFTDLEFGASRYDQPGYASVTAADTLLGTAMNGTIGMKGSYGLIKAFGRAVSAGYHAAGAQGRTVDYSWQFLGPFLNENSQIGPDGNIGIGMPNNPYLVPVNHSSRLNDRLIPPGSYVYSTTGPGAVWQHLRPYGPGEDIDPYGPATPNRVGGGAEIQGVFFKGILKPIATAEMFSNAEALTDASGQTLSAYTLNRYRGGLELDLEPWLGWPLRFGAGYTLTGSSSPDKDPVSGDSYGVTTSLMDGSVEWGAGKPLGLAVGYRSLQASGINERVNYKTEPYNAWDIVGIGGWWRPADKASVDVVYSMGHNSAPSPSTAVLEIDQFLTRLTVEF